MQPNPETSRWQGFKDIVAMVRDDCRTAWETSRPAEPEIPLFQEVAEEWVYMGAGQAIRAEKEERLGVLYNFVWQSAHTAYHNLARRRVRFWERERKIFTFFETRVAELIEERNQSEGQN